MLPGDPGDRFVDGEVRDISDLDPGATSAAEADWGALTDFASRAGEIVAKAAARAESASASRMRRPAQAGQPP